MPSAMLSKPCWRGGSTDSDCSMQSNNNFNKNESSSKGSEDDSSKEKSLEGFSTEGELKELDIQLRLIMHHGIPTSCSRLAYDPSEHMLALATKNGNIKVLKGCGLESILQPSMQCAIRFLQIFNSQSLLVCVNSENVIEVWDMSSPSLISSQKWNINITALAVIQDSTYFFIGDASGSVTVIQYDREQLVVNATAYVITVPQVFGDLSKDYSEKLTVKDILPQPNCEHERVLICYANGVCALWALHDGEVIAVCAHTASALEAFSEADSPAKELPADITADERNLTSACWCCGDGVKFATGYNNGDIWIWRIDQTPDIMLVSDSLEHDSFNCSSTPLRKLKTGCFVPINVLRWWEMEEEQEGFLCALGGKNATANDVLKVISVTDDCLSRSECSIDLVVPEQLTDCMTWSSSEEKSLIMALGSKGRLYAYDVKDSLKSFKSSKHIETSVIRPVSVDFSLSKSQVTKTIFIFLKKHGHVADYIMRMPRVYKPCLSLKDLQVDRRGFTFGSKQREYLLDLESEGCYLYITGHENGLVYFWDLSTQIMSICGPQFQENADSESIKCPVSSLDFCPITGLLAVGYANGLISLHSLNLDKHNSYRAKSTGEGNWSPTGGGLSTLWSLVSKFHTHEVPVSCIVISSALQRVASGCENGMVSLFDLKTKTILYSSSCFKNKSSRIVSLNFVSVPTQHNANSCWGFPALSRSKNKSTGFTRMQRILVTTKDSGILAFDSETGVFLKTSPFKLKNPSNAVALHVLDASDSSLDMPSECHSECSPQKLGQKVQNTQRGENETDGNVDTIKIGSGQCLLLCSENDLRIYNMPSSFEDVCSSFNKVKLNGRCQWASTFQTPNKKIGLILFYSTGKFEIRCLPSLKLLKSTSCEDFLNWKIEPTVNSLRHIACTSTGHIALVKSDDEILVMSVLDMKLDYRCSKLLPANPNAVKKKTGMGSDSSTTKKKTLRKVIKATNVFLRNSDKGNKVTNQKVADLDQLFTGKSSKTSGSLQSSHQLTDESHSESLSPLDLSSQSLDIDDIDIDDEDDPKDATTRTSGIKLISKFKKNMKGKVKLRSHDLNEVKSSKGDQVRKSDAELSPVHGPRTAGEIKAAYKQGKDHSVFGTAAGLTDKLMQQKQKIGEVERKTADMQDGAQQFHKMAEELYKAMEEKNKRKFF